MFNTQTTANTNIFENTSLQKGIKKVTQQKEIVFFSESNLKINGLSKFNYSVIELDTAKKIESWIISLSLGINQPFAIICEVSFYKKIKSLLQDLPTRSQLNKIPFILYSDIYNESDKDLALDSELIDDLFCKDEFDCNDLHERLLFLRDYKKKYDQTSNNYLGNSQQLDYSAKLNRILKRFFDILVASISLMLLTPLFIIIAILIKLESKGSVFYISKRAGSYFHVFNFYKFRTMKENSDKELEKLKDLNQYSNKDGQQIFFKINNDPRVTKVGSFLRNTSLDELPQLLNVLKGDMSLVGNRPLPLHEASSLTKDEWAKRFLAPAGLTGLWQVTKRGKKQMSIEERISLDIEYAKKNSFLGDLQIIFKTFPALIQKESV